MVGILVTLALALVGCGTSGASSTEEEPTQAATHVLTDMEGRSVEVPTTIDRVVTLGSVPVINGFLFALGKGDVIVNGLPDFALGGRWKYQYVFAPQIERQPQTQNADGAPQVEDIIGLNPDVILTMSPDLAEPLEKVGLKVIVLQWRDATDVKKVIDLLGELLNEPERAAAYTEYFDATLADVQKKVSAVAQDQRRTALYLSPKAMTRPHLIADWWIEQAGGRSVTAGSTQEVLPLNVEQVVSWNPDVIFVPSPADVEAVYADPRFAPLKAVVDKQVYSLPIAAHMWGNRTSEQPLTVFWAASKLYPDRVTEGDLEKEIANFYSTIFKVDLSEEQVKEIAAGL